MARRFLISDAGVAKPVKRILVSDGTKARLVKASFISDGANVRQYWPGPDAAENSELDPTFGGGVEPNGLQKTWGAGDTPDGSGLIFQANGTIAYQNIDNAVGGLASNWADFMDTDWTAYIIRVNYGTLSGGLTANGPPADVWSPVESNQFITFTPTQNDGISRFATGTIALAYDDANNPGNPVLGTEITLNFSVEIIWGTPV